MSRRLVCIACAAPFYPVTVAWGDSLCGECIAAAIEQALSPLALGMTRKPMRRASPLDDGLRIEPPVVSPRKTA